MNREYPCDIIRDLLPGYIDGILSETGNDAVKSHLETCGECRSNYEEMAEQIPGETEGGIGLKDQAALDGFRKVRRFTKKLKRAAVAATALLMLCIVSVFVKVYAIGSLTFGGSVEVREVFYDDETDALTLNGQLNLVDFHVSRVVWKESNEENFVINVYIYVAENLPFLPSGQERETFSVTIPDAKGYRVYLAGSEYQRSKVYDWKDWHYERMAALEEEIYESISELDRNKDALDSYPGIVTVEGLDGIQYSVTAMLGEDAYYWRTGEQLYMHGDFKTLDLDIWISLEEPYQILLYDYQTGEYTEDFDVLAERKRMAEPEDLEWGTKEYQYFQY